MRKVIWNYLILLAIGAGVSALAQAPQPGPEAKKLAMWAGNWQYEGNAKASPLGPESKISGKQTGRLVAGGFAIQNTAEESGPFGGVQWGEIGVYDPASKTYRFLGYQNDGAVWQVTGSVTGAVWKFSGTMTAKDTSYWIRVEETFAADGKSFTWKAEISTDGKSWAPWAKTKSTKTS